MMTDYQTAQDKIEKLVLKKKNTESTALAIQTFYSKYGSRGEALFTCCNWYRRLGKYQKALSLLKINSQNLKITLSTAAREGRKILWFARLSNLMGAPTIAFKLIQNIKPDSVEDHRIFGLIHLTNFSYEQAYQSFLKIAPTNQTYQNRLDRLSLSDCLVGLKRHQEALDINIELLTRAESEYETALVYQAIGEIYCGLNDWPNAGRYLHAAKKFFDGKNVNIDAAYLSKWLSLFYYQFNLMALCKKNIELATNTLIKLKAKEDALLLCIALQKEFQLLTAEQVSKFEVIEEIFYSRIQSESQKINIGNDKATIKINLGSGESVFKSKKGSRYLFEINKEMKLILLLKLFEDWGINSACVYDRIYGDEPFGITNAKDRIKSLIQRLNKIYGIKITLKDERLTISKSMAAKISILNVGPQPIYRFLENKAEGYEFQTKDVMGYYLISRTQTVQLIRRWQSHGLIMKHQGSLRIAGPKS